MLLHWAAGRAVRRTYRVPRPWCKLLFVPHRPQTLGAGYPAPPEPPQSPREHRASCAGLPWRVNAMGSGASVRTAPGSGFRAVSGSFPHPSFLLGPCTVGRIFSSASEGQGLPASGQELSSALGAEPAGVEGPAAWEQWTGCLFTAKATNKTHKNTQEFTKGEPTASRYTERATQGSVHRHE